jgi:hypothetical protein
MGKIIIFRELVLVVDSEDSDWLHGFIHLPSLPPIGLA